MRRLDAEGLITLIPNRGAFVSRWSEDEIKQIYELRVLLESFAAQVAAERITEAERADLRALADEMGRLVEDHPIDVDAIAEVNDRRSEEHTSELQSLMRISYAVFCLKKKKNNNVKKLN